MKVGSVSNPVPFTGQDGKQGYKILLLKSKVPPHKGNLEQDYAKFKERAQEEKMDKVLSEWFEKRRENTYIKIDDEFTDCSDLRIWTKGAAKQ
jgi:peptidyl-prolyl cis-trans isomerase SurA